MSENPGGFFGVLSAWIQAIGQFLYDNIGLTLIALWCFILFAMTEFAKPVIRRLVRAKEDKELAVKLFPQIMGAVTGYEFAPLIVTTTQWGAAWKIPGFVGVGAGFLIGIVTIGMYELSKSKRFVTLTKALIRKAMYKMPFLTKEEVDKILETETGVPTEDLNELQEIVGALKRFGEVDMTFDDSNHITMKLRLKDTPSTTHSDGGDPTRP